VAQGREHASPSPAAPLAAAAAGSAPDAPAVSPLPIPQEELDAMFAELRASEADPLKKIAGVADKKSQRVVLGLGGTVVLVALFLLLATVAGLFINR
jgi:hypothetical protein